MLDKNGIAKRIAREVKDGYYVNLGIGIPTLVANFVRDDIEVEFQSENGVANWKIPGKMVKGMGGAMDLVASAENIIVAMMHTNRAGLSKLLKTCSLPLTGVGCVKKIVTNMAVIEVTDKGFKLLERAPGVTVKDIKNATEGHLIIDGDIPEMKL